MTEIRGSLVRTKGEGWDSRYRNQVFLVTRVFTDESGRWTYQLYDWIGGGLIFAAPSEVKFVKRSAEYRRSREDRKATEVLGWGRPQGKVGYRDRDGRTR